MPRVYNEILLIGLLLVNIRLGVVVVEHHRVFLLEASLESLDSPALGHLGKHIWVLLGVETRRQVFLGLLHFIWGEVAERRDAWVTSPLHTAFKGV